MSHDRKTPETDAAEIWLLSDGRPYRATGRVRIEFARTLERQRNAARGEDAERYRWLRANSSLDTCEPCLYYGPEYAGRKHAEEVDAAIDAEMKKGST